MADWNYKSSWDESFSQLKNDLGEEEFSGWVNKIEYIRADENVIYAAAPSDFILGQFTLRYLPLLEKKIQDLIEKNITVTMEVRKKEAENKENTSPQVSPPKKNTPEAEKPRAPIPGPKNFSPPAGGEKKITENQLQDEYTFETYVVGEANTYAYNAALAVARNPGTNSIYNPLLIYGETGFGKTHLMQAMGNYIQQKSDLKILYITGEGFMREFVDIVALSKNKDAFAKKYRNVDALLIDDIHTIEKGIGTQDELFYTFEALINKKKQMVFTCDKPIAELKGMAPRLKSRFQKGLNVQLHLPDYEELIAILHKKLASKKAELKKDIVISDEIIELIVKNISSNIRDMEGALNKLMGYADLVNKPVTMDIAQRELRDIFSTPQQGNLSMDMIIKIVAEYYRLSPNELKGKKRTEHIKNARHIAIYLCRELTEYSLMEIGENFGGRDHATILHSHRATVETCNSDSNLYSTLEMLKRMIKEYNVK